MLPKFPKFGPELTSAKIALLGFLTRALKGGRLSLFLSENNVTVTQHTKVDPTHEYSIKN